MLDPLPQLKAGKPIDADLINSNFEALRLFNNDIVTRYQALLALSTTPPEYNAIIEDLHVFGIINDVTHHENKLEAQKLNENFEKFKVALLLTGINNKRINDAVGRGVDGDGTIPGSEDGLINGQLIQGAGADYYKEYVILYTPTLTGYDIINYEGHYFAPLSWTCGKCSPEQTAYQIFRCINDRWGEYELVYTKLIEEYSPTEYYADDLGVSINEGDEYYYKVRTLTPRGISSFSNAVRIEVPEEVLPNRPLYYPNIPYPPSDGTKSHCPDGTPWPPSGLQITLYFNWYASDWYKTTASVSWQDNADNAEYFYIASYYDDDRLIDSGTTLYSTYQGLKLMDASEHTTHKFKIAVQAVNDVGASFKHTLYVTIENLDITYKEYTPWP